MPKLSKVITSGRYVFLDSNEGRGDGPAGGPAWRVMTEWEGEATTSIPVVRVIGEGGKGGDVARVPYTAYIKNDGLRFRRKDS